MNKALRVSTRMTVEEFQDWRPPTQLHDRRWQLFDGEPRYMSPASENHGAIQSEAAVLLTLHLRATRPSCRVITAPGVIPPIGARFNERVPDLGITCAPAIGSAVINSPILLIEILSPSNTRDTRANVWAYTSIPTVQDVLLLASRPIAAELLSRDPDGNWPSDPLLLGAEDELRLPSIAFAAPLRAFYATTSLA